MPRNDESQALPFPDAPASAPEAAGGVPVPTLSAEPPLDPILPLEGMEDAGGEAPRPRRGRPPKGSGLSMTPSAIRKREARARAEGRAPAPPEEPAAPTPTPEELAQAAATLSAGFLILSKFVATRRGGHWELSSGEAGELGTAWATAMAPWLGGITKAAPMGTAIILTIGALAPRIMQDAELAPAGEVVNIAPPPPPAPAAASGDAPPPPPPSTAPLAGGGPILPPKRKAGGS